MKVEITCKYCGKIWEENVYSQEYLSGKRCSTCGDRDLRIKPYDEAKIDGYVGCPPFPPKDIKKDDSPEIEYGGG